jgi:hypothetical protein
MECDFCASFAIRERASANTPVFALCGDRHDQRYRESGWLVTNSWRRWRACRVRRENPLSRL